MAYGTIPYFSELGKRDGYERNTVLVDFCTYLVAFWDLESRGTYDAIKKAKKVGKLKCVYGPNGLEVEI